MRINYFHLKTNIEGIQRFRQSIEKAFQKLLRAAVNFDPSDSAAQELDAERLKLEIMFDQSPAGIALLRGSDLVFEKINKRWAELASPREYLGRSYSEAYPGLIATDLLKNIQKVYETGKTFAATELLFRVEKSNGVLEDRYFDLSYMRVLDKSNKKYGIFCYCTDATKRVLARLAAEADAKELSLAIEALKEEEHLREDFVAALSHDLRTPLASAKMAAQLLTALEHDSDAIETLRKRVVLNVDRVESMIADMLDAGRIKSGKKCPSRSPTAIWMKC